MQSYNLIRICGGQDAVGRLGKSLSPLLSCRPLPTLLFMARTSYRTHFWLGDVCLSLKRHHCCLAFETFGHIAVTFLNVAMHQKMSCSIIFHHVSSFLGIHIQSHVFWYENPQYQGFVRWLFSTLPVPMSGGKAMFLGTVSPAVELWFLLVVLPCLNLLGRLNHDLIATSLESSGFFNRGIIPTKNDQT